MAESMSGLRRSHRCTEVANAQLGEVVTLMGWVNKRRNLGSLIFVDLRDRSGIMQILFHSDIIHRLTLLLTTKVYHLVKNRTNGYNEYRDIPYKNNSEVNYGDKNPEILSGRSPRRKHVQGS